MNFSKRSMNRIFISGSEFAFIGLTPRMKIIPRESPSTRPLDSYSILLQEFNLLSRRTDFRASHFSRRPNLASRSMLKFRQYYEDRLQVYLKHQNPHQHRAFKNSCPRAQLFLKIQTSPPPAKTGSQGEKKNYKNCTGELGKV